MIEQASTKIATLGTTYNDSLKGSTSIVEAVPQVVPGYLELFAHGQWPEVEVTSR